MSEKRDLYRKAVMATPAKRQSKTVTVDVNGAPLEFELRAPSIDEESQIAERSQVIIPPQRKGGDVKVAFNQANAKAWSAIFCVFIPGTEERVFEKGDLDALLKAQVGSWHDKLCGEAMAIRQADEEQIAKNSEATAGVSSS